MKKQDAIEILQKEIEIPKTVQEKADAALKQIQDSSLGSGGKLLPYRQAARPGKHFRKRAAVAAAAAAISLFALTGAAAVYRNWSRSLSEGLHISEEQQQELESNQMASFVEQSCTDNGITVTAQQSITDTYYTHLSFKIEGYQLEAGAEPFLEVKNITIDGREDFDWNASFYNGIVSDGSSRPVLADGSSLESLETDENGLIPELSYTMEDGSLEYHMILSKTDEKGYFLDKPIHVELKNLGTVAKAEYFPDVEGNWTFDWTLQGHSITKECDLNVPLGDSGATVTHVEISPLSLTAEYQFPRQEITGEYMDENQEVQKYTFFTEPPALMGVRLKDGTTYPSLCMGPGSMGYLDEDSDTYLYSFAIDRILDVEQVECLLFLKEASAEESSLETAEFYEVPIE